ncbi:hypothetical protein ACIRD3_33605 [Kitasatospora sp. NPDC093550]|uniref:hypothetical protein n=1 Tax=Kitasatospora sp. NPDC093550 TaxID=3364089 RepID=UPI00381E3EA4
MSVPRRRRRLPDEVRAAAVRAVLSLAFTLVGVVVATLASYAGSSMLAPALMAMGLGVFATMWCLLEILVSRQVAAQRMRAPGSAHPMSGSRAPSEPLAARPFPRPGAGGGRGGGGAGGGGGGGGGGSVYQQPYQSVYHEPSPRPYGSPQQPPHQPRVSTTPP